MTIHSTDDMMRSDRTPESAHRTGIDTWQLSWLPEHALSHEQARAGMELDELASDLAAVHDRRVHAEITARADIIGIIWEEALIKLDRRITEHLRGEPEPVHDPPGTLRTPPRLRRTGSLRRRDDRAPRVYNG